jgi:hypothetical protein
VVAVLNQRGIGQDNLSAIVMVEVEEEIEDDSRIKTTGIEGMKPLVTLSLSIILPRITMEKWI